MISGINPLYHIWVRFNLEGGIINPSKEGPYILKLRTSSQPNDADSPPYYITLAVGGATVTVIPPTALYVNAEYQIDMDISDKGPLTKDVSSIKIQFPNNDINGFGGGYAAVASTIPTAISARNVYINDVQCTMNPNIDWANRIVTFFMPVSVDAKGHVKIVITSSAGMKNPVVGSYKIKLQTSVEPIWIDSKPYQIYSTLGGLLGGRNPVVAVSYLIATTLQDALAGATTVNVDQTVGWQANSYAAIGNLTNWFEAQVIRVTRCWNRITNLCPAACQRHDHRHTDLLPQDLQVYNSCRCRCNRSNNPVSQRRKTVYR